MQGGTVGQQGSEIGDGPHPGHISVRFRALKKTGKPLDGRRPPNQAAVVPTHLPQRLFRLSARPDAQRHPKVKPVFGQAVPGPP